MSRKWFAVLVIISGLLGGHGVQAQQAPDTILYNGKVVTVDNHGVNEQLGTMAQALAIKGTAIVAVGTDARIRALAGPNTKSIDLKGRMVLPGFHASHEHPNDWDLLNPLIVKKVEPNDDIVVERFLEGSPDQQVQELPRVLDEAVHKAKPGQWIKINMLRGKDYQWDRQMGTVFPQRVKKQLLDLGAPDNPVLVRDGMAAAVVNQKAIDVTDQHYGDQIKEFINHPLKALVRMNASFPAGSLEQSGYCTACYRELEGDVIYPPDVLREIFRLGLSWESGYGITFVGNTLWSGGQIRAYSDLDRKGQMAIRMGWSWYWPERNDFFADPYFVQYLVNQEGKGSDYLWLTGMAPDMGGGCSKLPPTPQGQEAASKRCYYRGFSESIKGHGMGPQPETNNTMVGAYRALYEYIKAGGRFVGNHMTGDADVDIVLDIIEKASKDGGMTLAEIRAKRHVTEHMAMYPRPDQIPRFKNLGMMTSGSDMSIWQGSGESVLRDFGERGVMQMYPRRSLNEAGVMNALELDRPIEVTNVAFFTALHASITRKDRDGKVYAPQQAVSRQAILKTATLFGAYYAMRENKLGSLEPGKFADFMVLDRDYLTIPVDDIPKIRVLMTMVGGKVEHLVPSLAREWGMKPTGAQVELSGPAAQW